MYDPFRPNLIERMKIAWSVFNNGFPRKSGPFAWPDWRTGTPEWQIVDFQTYVGEGFNANSLIYGAIMYKVRSLWQVPLMACKGDPQRPVRLPPDNDLSKLVARPNMHQSWMEFQGQNTVYLNIAGNCYIWLERPKAGGLPESMYSMRPDRVFIVPGDKGDLQGYVYVPEGRTAWNNWDRGQRRRALDDGRALPILPEDMIHVKLPNPLDPLEGLGYGLSPISPLAYSADTDNSVTKFLKLFFDRGGAPPYWFSFEVPLNDADLARIREELNDETGGWRNWTRSGVLDKGGKVERIGLTFDEMGFGDLDSRNETRILGPFGVPPILVGSRSGLERSTYSNYAEARRQCWEDTLIPETTLFETEYHYYLQDGANFVTFDYSGVPALQKDKPALIEAAHKMWTMGVPASQAFEVVGLDVEELPEGDTGYVPINMTPIGLEPEPVPAALAPAAEPTPPTDDNEGAAEAEEEAEEEEGKSLEHKESRLTPEQKEAFHLKADRIALSWEPKFMDAAGRAFERDKREVLALVGEAKAKALRYKQTPNWVETITAVDAYLATADEGWRDTFIPVMLGLMAAQGEALATEFNFDFNMRDLRAEAWFDDYVMKFAQDVVVVTGNDLNILFKQALAEGWSIDTTANRLEQLFNQYMKGNMTPAEFEWFEARMPYYRREMIARTETIRASNKGAQSLYQEWGIEAKEWHTARDERVCPWCAEMHGTIIGTADNYFYKGDVLNLEIDGKPKLLHLDYEDVSGPPLHTNCRCTLLPVI